MVIAMRDRRYLRAYKWCGLMRIAMGELVRMFHRTPAAQSLFMAQFNGWAIGIATGASPLWLGLAPSSINPVLTARNVTDVEAAFVADPFMIHDGSRWHLFFEVFSMDSRRGEIGHATSEDGLRWSYDRIVLRESFHLSYPYVFRTSGEYYMVPESAAAGTVSLYRAVTFPTTWERVTTLLSGEYVDSSVIEHGGRWWMFSASGARYDTLRLFHADTLHGPWHEHPESPMIVADGHRARPGGRIIVHGGKIIRFAQDDLPRYGVKVRAFIVTALTPSRFAQEEVPMPALAASGQGWHHRGMHHVDPHPNGSRGWIAAVDGFEHDYLFFSY